MMTKTKIKKITGMLALTVAAMLLGVVLGGLLPSRTDKGIELSTKATEAQGGALIDAGRSNGVKLTSAKLSAGEYAANGVSAQTESAYTLTASVYPEDAANKVDWTVSFTNAASEWASGKTVTDYVTVSTATDGALTAVVENKTAFGEQIQVKVASRENPDVYATCHVEYLQRTIGYRFSIHGNFHLELSTQSPELSVKPTFASKNAGYCSMDVEKTTVYTRTNTDKAEYFTVKPTETFKVAITDAGLAASALKEYAGGKNYEFTDFVSQEWGEALYGSSAVNKNKLINLICNFHTNAYEITLYAEKAGKKAATFYVYFDASLVIDQKAAERMEVDETELVF